MIGFFQVLTSGSIPSIRMGVRNTVPSRMLRMVAFGLLYIFLRLNSCMRSRFAVIVAHLTATPYFFVAIAESIVT